MDIKRILLAGIVGVSAVCANGQQFVQGHDNPDGVLSGRNIAMWQSHGRYYDITEDRWKWQRCRLFGTVEDLYTRSYVVPFLIPMLENAGAYVMLPRERDENEAELVIDPDGEYSIDGYNEENGKHKWKDVEAPGFGWCVDVLLAGENPFTMGHARQVKTVKPKDARRKSSATWSAIVPEYGDYAVYVSYPKLENAAPDARYTVHTAAGDKQFTVNQSMGTATWVYLGTFPFAPTKEAMPLVSLDNVSSGGDVVGADAVRIGGGIGNVARHIDEMPETAHVSGYPRWAEASRYYLQWAGMPDTVYSNQENDYRDDIFCRPQWVNYMMQELGVPVDLVMAFHSDAGVGETEEELVGTMGIHFTARGGKYADGRSRRLGGKLCRSIVNSVVEDISAIYAVDWPLRKIRDASYIEARVAEVPTMLLELLSHQNFHDMKFGLDPQFKFNVSRAVYKGILRYLANQKLAQYIVQPLPPKSMMIAPISQADGYLLSWNPDIDPLEPTAFPTSYIIEQRIGSDVNAPFVPIDTIRESNIIVNIPKGEIRSYRVIAVNKGGHSFSSEVLAAGSPANPSGHVTVVNGFTRVSAPDHFSHGSFAGFGLYDPGVPYIKDMSYTGAQYEFNRLSEWVHDDQPGFGASRADMETKPVYGNSFDNVIIHGKAIMEAGYSFSGRSLSAFIDTQDRTECVDLILGLQRQSSPEFKAFPAELQTRLDSLVVDGVPVFVSGANLASDCVSSPEDLNFLERVLGIKWRSDHATVIGSVSEVNSQFADVFADASFEFSTELGQKPYAVTSPDAIYPASELGSTIMRYNENQSPAAVAFAPLTHRAVSLGFPFEAVQNAESRTILISQILKFLNRK